MLTSFTTSLPILFVCATAHKHYEGYKFVDIFPNSVENLKVVSGFGDDHYDVIRRARNVGQQATLFLKPDQVAKIKNILEEHGVVYNFRDPHFTPINHTRSSRFVRSSNGNGKPSSYYNMGIYQSYDEQMEYLKVVAEDYPSFVSLGSLGKSFEGREIKYLTIGYASSDSKPTLFIDAGIHAREWIAPAVALWTIQELTKSNEYHSLLERIDIVILPNLNPDGYEFSRREDRWWRKNRRTPPNGSTAYGVDLNRNFPFHYGVGASDDPRDQTYKGPNPLSEPESRLLSTFLEQNKDRFKAYLTLHSTGPWWAYPWGYAKNAYPEDVHDLIDLGNRAAEAIASVRGSQYEVVSTADGISVASGASDDFAKNLGIKYVYTVELSNHQETENDFELPEKFIVPTSQEVFQGILVVAETVAK